MSNTSKKKMGPKQIIAIIGVVLLVSMYLVALILALIGTEWSKNMLYIALIATFVIPIILYFIMMFYKLANPKKDQTIEVPVDESSEKTLSQDAIETGKDE